MTPFMLSKLVTDFIEYGMELFNRSVLLLKRDDHFCQRRDEDSSLWRTCPRMASRSETTGDKLLGFESGQSIRLHFAGEFFLSVRIVELGDVVEMPHCKRRRRFGLLAGQSLDFGGDAVVDRQELADFTGRLASEFRDLLL